MTRRSYKYTRIKALSCFASNPPHYQITCHTDMAANTLRISEAGLLRRHSSEGGCNLSRRERLPAKDQLKKTCFSCFLRLTLVDKWHQRWAFAWLGGEGPFILIRTNIAIREIEGLSYLSQCSLLFLGQKNLLSINLRKRISLPQRSGASSLQRRVFFWGGAARSDSIWDELLARDHTVCTEWKWLLMVMFPKESGLLFSLIYSAGRSLNLTLLISNTVRLCTV